MKKRMYDSTTQRHVVVYSLSEELQFHSSRGTVIDSEFIRERAEFWEEASKLSEKQKQIIKATEMLKDYAKDLGGFVHMCYVKNNLLFGELNISRANIARLMYLATFIDYNDREENLLVKRACKNTLTAMTRLDLKSVCRISDRSFYNFISEMKDIGVLYEAEDKFYLSNDYFTKGKSDYKNSEYTRIFIDTTRTIYENCKVNQHKYLSDVFKLIPYLHYELNILCENPGEENFFKIRKLSFKQICEILNISTDKSNMNKIRRELLRFNVKIANVEYYLFSYVRVINGFGMKDFFAVNPSVIWSGTREEMAKDTLGKLFFE
ncbi:MAG: hypothetical protein ACRDDY_17040 [Clostridium sp.]|uniref:hypothetical protein n=1 Tax=Clostridium sp. TaxID=1506 RepID=UPI003EE6A197